MDVSEHLQRELLYGLNATLLRMPRFSPGASRDVDTLARELTRTLWTIVRREGPRVHEPALLEQWAESAVMDTEELALAIEDALWVVLEELEDAEEPYSAHRVLDLLAEEPFWTLRWTAGVPLLPTPLDRARGLALPLAMRASLVGIFNTFELAIFELKQDQRSVHDPLPVRDLDTALDTAMRAVRSLVRQFHRKGAPEDLSEALMRTGTALPSLRSALERIQLWKWSVDFDASPDDDDGEWTLRVLERLYPLEWVV